MERTGKMGENIGAKGNGKGDVIGRHRIQEGGERKDKRGEAIITERKLAKGKRQL